MHMFELLLEVGCVHVCAYSCGISCHPMDFGYGAFPHRNEHQNSQQIGQVFFLTLDHFFLTLPLFFDLGSLFFDLGSLFF